MFSSNQVSQTMNLVKRLREPLEATCVKLVYVSSPNLLASKFTPRRFLART
jgi:hypothetical protein